jgi:transposase-like protein
MARVILTPEQRSAIVEAYRSGRSSKSIADEFGVTDTFVRSLASKNGAAKMPGRKPPRKLPDWTEKEVAIVADMMRSKASVDQIAERFRISRQSVGRRVKSIPLLAAIGFVPYGQIRRPAAVRQDQAKRAQPAPVIIDLEFDPAPYRTATGCHFFVKGEEGIDGLVCNRPFQGGPLSRWCRRHAAIVYAAPAVRRAAA